MTRRFPILATIFIVGVLGYAGCSQSEEKTNVRVVADIPYKQADSLTDYERERCKLDLYLPATQKFPVVVWFHGGGLEEGNKSDADPSSFGRSLAAHGVAAAVVNYRLSPKATYPAYVEDAAAAVAYVKKHIVEQGGDASRLIVAGHSAGGYLAAMITYDPKYLASHGLSSKDIAGVIPVSPQVFTHFTIRKERGLPNPQHTPVVDDAAPTYHVNKDGPPTLVLIADNDWPARLEECQYFMAMLKEVKHPAASLQIVPGRDHGSIAAKAHEEGDPVLKAVLGFVEKH